MWMKKRNVSITLIVVLGIFLGCFLTFLKNKNNSEIKGEPNKIDTGFEDDPIVKKHLQSVESTQSAKIEDKEQSETIIDYALTADQKNRAVQLTSLFENGKIEIQYAYAENLDDGRGITAGRAGFTTRDGDAYMVVKAYANIKPGNKLQKYLEPLKKLAEEESDSTDSLSGFKKAWKEAAKDSKFRDSQDYIVDKLYFQPSQKYANDSGLKTAIARAFFYDTIIQHGDGDDKDSIRSLIKSTNSKLDGSPKDGVDELKWLEKFMDVRKIHLSDAADESTRDAWADSIGRVDVYKQIFNDENYELKGPIEIKTKEYDTTIP
jgi:chitosanase